MNKDKNNMAEKYGWQSTSFVQGLSGTFYWALKFN